MFIVNDRDMMLIFRQPQSWHKQSRWQFAYAVIVKAVKCIEELPIFLSSLQMLHCSALRRLKSQSSAILPPQNCEARIYLEAFCAEQARCCSWATNKRWQALFCERQQIQSEANICSAGMRSIVRYEFAC